MVGVTLEEAIYMYSDTEAFNFKIYSKYKNKVSINILHGQWKFGKIYRQLLLW